MTPESADYLVAVDVGALLAPFKAMGVSYDSAVMKFKVFEQDDGAWRVEQTDFPALVAHTKQGDRAIDSTIALSGFNNVIVIDPVDLLGAKRPEQRR